MSHFLKNFLPVLVLLVLMVSCQKKKKETKKQEASKDYASYVTTGDLTAELTAPPHVPKPVGNRDAKKLTVEMEIKEEEGEMTDGVRYMYWDLRWKCSGEALFVPVLVTKWSLH